MTTSTALRPSARVALHALIDYAGLFPPAELSLAQAQREYDAAGRGPHAWMLGRFIIPAALLTESSAMTSSAPLSVILDPNVDAMNAVAAVRESALKIEALEIPLGKTMSPFRKHLSRDEVLDVVGALEADLTLAGLRDLPAFVEIPRDEPWHGMFAETMSALARTGLAAKLRCGGVTAEAFPSVDEVVDFIGAAHEARVPFKATAGLHHPVRHLDPSSGFTMHGFLNLLAASALASRVDRETLRRIVAEEEPAAFEFDDESFAWRRERVAVAGLTAVRSTGFVAYGSCSFAEPVEDLRALAVLPVS
jgi:hypothetical protein